MSSQAKLILFALFALLLAACNRQPAPAGQMPGAGVRLPPEVAPERYDITVTPDAQARTFRGSVRIAIDVKGETRRVILNALEPRHRPRGAEDGTAAKVTLDPKAQTALSPSRAR